MSPISERTERMLAEYEAGYTTREIGTRHGVSHVTAYQALCQHPDFKPRKRGIGRWRAPFVAVPAWVESAHHERYRNIAASNGEEVAAGCLRRLKALEARA